MRRLGLDRALGDEPRFVSVLRNRLHTGMVSTNLRANLAAMWTIFVSWRYGCVRDG